MDANVAQGVLIFIPTIEIFLSMQFGSGDNLSTNDRVEGLDSYIDYTMYEFANGEFEENDGGQLDYNGELIHYETILDVIPDIFIHCDINKDVPYMIIQLF